LLAIQPLWMNAPASAQTASDTPIRLEGYILALGPDKWQVGSSLEGIHTIWVTPETPIASKGNYSPALGAWVIVYAMRRPSGELHAQFIHVERPAGAPGIRIQFTGTITKQGNRYWSVGDTPIEVTEETRRSGVPVIGSFVWVSATITPIVLRAEWIVVLEQHTAFEFRGMVTEVGHDYVIIDEQRLKIDPLTETYGKIAVNALVECRAVEDENGDLIATYLRELSQTADGERITGSIVSITPLGEGVEEWLVLHDGPSRMASAPVMTLVTVDGDTLLDESRAVAAKHQWIAVRGIPTGQGIYQAKVIRVERGAQASGAASLSSSLAASSTPWGAPTSIAERLDSAERPTLAFTQNGVAHAVWETNFRLQYAWRAPGGTWSAPQPIAYGFSPHMLVDDRGALHVAFVNLFEGDYDIYYITMQGGTWSLPINMSYTSGGSFLPRLALGSDQVLHVVWQDNTPGYWTTYYGTYGGRYWSNRPVPSGRGESPAIGVAADGTIYAVWQHLTSREGLLGDMEVYLSECRDGIWDVAVNISDSEGVHSLGPDVTTTGDGLAHVVWVDDERDVRYSYGQGVYWSLPTNIRSTLDYAHTPRILAEGGVYLHVVWDEETALLTASAPPGAESWPEIYEWGGQSGWLRDASLAPIAAGGVALVWAIDNGTKASGVYARMRMPILTRAVWLPLLIWRQTPGDPVVP
jgi:hypothetical protein